MPNYVRKDLERIQHPVPTRPQHSTHKWLAPMYAAKLHYYPDATTTPKLEKRSITRMQSISGTFWYISCAVEPTMLVVLNKAGAKQALPITNTIKKTRILKDYAATQRYSIIRFHVSDMYLHIDSNAAYMVQPKAHSRAVGHYYLSNNPPPTHIRSTPTPNELILTTCQTIRTVMDSAAETETGAIFLNGQQAVPILTALIEMGHPQLPTPIKTESATSHGILTSNMCRKRSKDFDMRFYWMRCRIKQNQFRLYCHKGTENLADYFTKHFPPKYHRRMRYVYLQREIPKTFCQRKTQVKGCVISTASQAFMHSCLTARARLAGRHVHDYMARAYRAQFISTYMAHDYHALFISTYRPRAYC